MNLVHSAVNSNVIGEASAASKAHEVTPLSFTPLNFSERLAALDEEYPRKREEMANELLGKLSAREGVLLDELNDIRQQKEEIAKQCGVTASLPQGMQLPHPYVRKRPPRREDAARIEAVEVIVKPTAKAPDTIRDAIVQVLRNGDEMGRKEIVAGVIALCGDKFKPESIQFTLSSPAMDKLIDSQKDHRPGAHHASRVYWLKKEIAA